MKLADQWHPREVWCPASASGFCFRVSCLQVGSQTNDHLGQHGLIRLASNKVAVLSALHDSGSLIDAGAVTLIDADAALSAGVNSNESVVESSAGGGAGMASAPVIGFDASRNQLAVDRPASDIVTLLRVVDLIYADDFE